jgi:hypothetical protein
MFVIEVDTHKRSHTLVAFDGQPAEIRPGRGFGGSREGGPQASENRRCGSTRHRDLNDEFDGAGRSYRQTPRGEEQR